MFFSKNICDPKLKVELGDKLLDPESDEMRDLFLSLLDKNNFDIALTFSTGGISTIQYLKEKEPLYAQFANHLIYSEYGSLNQLCPANSVRLNEKESMTKITNLLYNKFNIPLFSINVGCCKMPKEETLAETWRENLPKIKKFLKLLGSGVKGYVVDEKGVPLRDAKITILRGDKMHRVSKNMAFFHVLLPNGDSVIEISAPGYDAKDTRLNIEDHKLIDMGKITLKPEDMSKKKFLLSGFVTDFSGSPITNAEITVKDFPDYKGTSDSVGFYQIKNIPVENPVIVVNAPNFRGIEKLVKFNQTEVKNVVFKLKEGNGADMGFKNLIFIFVICLAILVSVVCCTFFIIGGCQVNCPCAAWFNKNSSFGTSNRQYKFSLLGRKPKRPELFEDEFDESETEDILVKEFYPKSKVREYRDEEEAEDNIDDFTDDGSEEDVVLVRNSPR